MLTFLKQNFELNRLKDGCGCYEQLISEHCKNPLPRKMFSAGPLFLEEHSGPDTVFFIE